MLQCLSVFDELASENEVSVGIVFVLDLFGRLVFVTVKAFD